MGRSLRLLTCLFLVACARPPGALRGAFSPVTPGGARAGGAVGERVRWGGAIVNVRPGRDATCFEIVSKPLDPQARPRDGDETFGRFVACVPGFYDPAIYAPQRELTVTGTLAEPMQRQVGEYDYRFPVVKADTVYLWPRRERVAWGGTLWWPYPYWGWGVGGFVEVPASRRGHRRDPRR